MSESPVVEPRGLTPGSLPYPEDTDLVMQGAQAIKALAQAIDARPRLRARKSGVYNCPGNNTDSEQGSGPAVWDLFEVNYNNASDVVGMVAPIAGYYLCTLSAAMLVPGATTNQMFGCKVLNNSNAAEGLGDQKLCTTPAGSTRMTVRCSGIIKAAAGDIIRASVHQNTGATQSLGGPTADWYTRFGVQYVGP